MLICNKCNLENSDATKFCGNCGTSLAPHIKFEMPEIIEFIKQKKLEAITNAINSGFDVNIHDANGISILFHAIQFGNLDIVKTIVIKGANVNYKNNQGITPLMVAASINSLEIVKLLIDAKANITDKDIKGKNAIDYAVERDLKEIVKYLKKSVDEQKSNKKLVKRFLPIIFLVVAYLTWLFLFTSNTLSIDLSIDLGKGVKLEMVKIPAGTFVMGCPDNEPYRGSSEGPAHAVTISKDFYIGKFEVTQAQWQIITGSNPSNFKSGNNYPVEMVSLNDICETGGFLEKINQLKPGGYSGFRLPTEAEREYSCRANTTTSYYWGGDNLDALYYCWYIYNSDEKTHPVGQKLPNKFGLYDMSGNVWEWCSDNYGDYSGLTGTDPTGPIKGLGRVIRGGGWFDSVFYQRSVIRGYCPPSHRDNSLGFRLALSPGQD